MPKLLPERMTADCIEQYRRAARIRREDAWRLAASARTTAAVYLWGYAAEMMLKAAWFALNGYPEQRPIVRADFDIARRTAAGYGLSLGNLHAVDHWARLLVQHRIMLGRNYNDVSFGAEIVRQSERVYARWREALRYKKNRAYPFEVRAVASAVEWLWAHSREL